MREHSKKEIYNMAETTITFKLDVGIDKRLSEIAEANHRSKSAQIRMIIQNYLDNR